MAVSALFSVARGSDISPRELAAAGFTMQEGKFCPANFEEVKQRLGDRFIVNDESTPLETVFGFYAWPY